MRTDNEVELEWYFGGKAEADLGVRSVQGGFEAAMVRMSLCEPVSAWTWSEAENRHTRNPDSDVSNVRGLEMPARGTEPHNRDAAINHLIERPDKLEDFRRIYARLHALPDRHRTVLELHFGDHVRHGGLSLSLLCQCKKVQEATENVNRRRKERAQKKGENPPEILGARDAIECLATSPNVAEQTNFAELVAEASVWLRAALEAYGRVR